MFALGQRHYTMSIPKSPTRWMGPVQPISGPMVKERFRKKRYYWITTNTWRWSDPELTQKYISSVRETEVECATLNSMLRGCAASDCAALVIDVQGAELSVLRGMRSARPHVIQYEDDRGFDVGSFLLLRTRGYRCVHSSSDMIFEAGGGG